MMEKRNFACYSKHCFLMDKKYLLKNGWKVCPREVPVETNQDMKTWNVVKHLPKKRAQVAQLRWLRPKTFKKS